MCLKMARNKPVVFSVPSKLPTVSLVNFLQDCNRVLMTLQYSIPETETSYEYVSNPKRYDVEYYSVHLQTSNNNNKYTLIPSKTWFFGKHLYWKTGYLKREFQVIVCTKQMNCSYLWCLWAVFSVWVRGGDLSRNDLKWDWRPSVSFKQASILYVLKGKKECLSSLLV